MSQPNSFNRDGNSVTKYYECVAHDRFLLLKRPMLIQLLELQQLNVPLLHHPCFGLSRFVA